MNMSNEQFSFTLPKAQRLSSKLEIEELFEKGIHYKAFPLRIIILNNLEIESEFPRLLVSVPKKKFKLAKDRNLLKRRIKEAYRLNKKFVQNKNIKSIGIIYVSNRTETFNIIQDKLILALNRLDKKNV